MCPFGQIGVLHLPKDLGIAPQRAVYRQLRGHLLADFPRQFLVQMRVLQHLAVGREDGSILLPQLDRHRLAISINLLGNDPNGPVQAGDFGADRGALDGATRDHKPLVLDHQRFADGNAGRNGNSLQ